MNSSDHSEGNRPGIFGRILPGIKTTLFPWKHYSIPVGKAKRIPVLGNPSKTPTNPRTATELSLIFRSLSCRVAAWSAYFPPDLGSFVRRTFSRTHTSTHSTVWPTYFGDRSYATDRDGTGCIQPTEPRRVR